MGTAPHLRSACIPGRWPGIWIPGYMEAPRPGTQALLQPTPSLPPPPPSACWVQPLAVILVCCAQCLCFINRPSRRTSAVCRNPRTMTMDGWAQRFLTAPCVLRAPWTVGHSVCSPASCSQRCSPGDGPSFMHCTCHELTLRQPAPKPASGTAPASVPLTMGPIAIGA